MEPDSAKPPELGGADVPLSVRIHLGRAAVQTIAVRHGVDLLHIKGDAVDPALRPPGRTGSDIDVMVRPSHVAILDVRLRRHGWKLHTTFLAGSPFGHAQTYLHEVWGYLDLHRWFPGIGLEAEAAFAYLWRSRASMKFGGVDCAVPAVPAQGAILVLNAARAGEGVRFDLDRAWKDAEPRNRAAIDREVRALDARLAFDAAFGDLERHRRDRDYRLWKAVSTGGGRFEEWWGRVRAARSARERLAVVALAPRVNSEALRVRLGRVPTRRDIIVEFFRRPARAMRQLLRSGGPG